MRIAIVMPQAPFMKGGIEKTVGEVTRRLKGNFEFEIFCTGKNTETIIWEGIPIYICKGYTSSYFLSISLMSKLKNSNFDLLHSHGFTNFPALAATLTKGERLVLFNPHFHPIGSSMMFNLGRKFYDYTLGKFIIQNAKKIICVSTTEKQSLIEKFGIKENRIVVIPNGVNKEVINKAKPIFFDKKSILYVGRIEKYKNIHLIVEALRYLLDWTLIIIGNGPYKLNIEKIISYFGLKERVTIYEHMSDEEVYSRLKTCSVFVNLSRVEAFGITILEALAAGKPVVVNNKYGLKELAEKFRDEILAIDIDNCGLKDIANAIEIASRRKCNVDLSEYSWDNISKKYKEVYINEF